MSIKLFFSTLAATAALLTPYWALAKDVTIASPDGNIEVSIDDNDFNLKFSLVHGGKLLVNRASFGLNLSEEVNNRVKIKKVERQNDCRETIKAPFHHTPEFSVNYNEAQVRLSDGTCATFRVFNDGVAYRLYISTPDSVNIFKEIADFPLVGNPLLYMPLANGGKDPMTMAFQNFYTVTPISTATPHPAFLPLTADFGDGVKVTLLESDLRDYPGMFITADSAMNTLSAKFPQRPKSFEQSKRRQQRHVVDRHDYIARVDGKSATPWRILAVTYDDREMPVNNLVYTLAEPSRLEDISWIKPGKAAWEWWNNWGLRGVPFKAGINNDTYKYFIDFASQNGIEYIVLDEGWYDPANGDMLSEIPDLNLPELVEYGKQKNVGLWLWCVFNVLDDNLEEICRKYSDMGIKGLKVDFLDRDDQDGVQMAWRIADAAARHKLMLDLHGFYKPSGMNRTYPNIVNVEGVFGLEELKWSAPTVDMPLYDVTFPFIRMMSGPSDYTPGAMLNASKSDWKAIYSSPMSQGTRAHQMACYIVQDSPFTMLADSPSNYVENQECTDFITSVPTTFDSTTILDGKMGEYIVTLREKDGIRYVGAQTSWTPRDYIVDFSFLPEGQSFEAHIFSDGVNAARQARDYAIETVTVNSGSKKNLHLAPGGGFVMKIEPVE
ncbi:MAG: glycoside hydrolase family 97 protein [Muribaculum sp.]|nr:glycoside hydrolase family 97 protein [Muribaculum sp.]